MVKSRVYVEGGGDTKTMRAECRKAFSMFFSKAGLTGRMPRIFACGARQHAYRDFCNAFDKARDDEFIVLLVDSEAPIASDSDPWTHLKHRDNWNKPRNATDDNVYLMVQCMEAWFLADKDSLEKFFGGDFNRNALPARPDVENIPKGDIEKGLNMAARRCRRKGGAYHKGRHSFTILAELDSRKVIDASPHAERLVRTLTLQGKAAE